MENREQQILSEIRQMISSIHAQLEMLEEKLELLEEAQSEVYEPAQPEALEETPVEIVEEAPVEIDIEDVLDDFIVTEPLPEGEILIDAAAAVLKPAVIDTMTNREAWRTDIPGSAVKDIRSAISLNDRILFINSLFDEDPMLFQAVLTKINAMTDLDEVVEYIRAERPAWDMESDEVYRFMMAVRRRIQ